MTAILATLDPTLSAIEAIALRDAQACARVPDWYLKPDDLGHPCARKGWLTFRWAQEPVLTAAKIRARLDQEAAQNWLLAQLLAMKSLETITVHSHDGRGGLLGFEDLGGHFRGVLAGVLEGMPQSPRHPHAWEHRTVTEASFGALEEILAAHQESDALEAWDLSAYLRAQLFMLALEVDRHYLTVASPGAARIVGVRTRRNQSAATWAKDHAAQIIFADEVPPRLSAASVECNDCEFQSLCHGSAIPKVSCRTCGHSTPRPDGNATWHCALLDKNLPFADQLVGCRSHMIHPQLIDHLAEILEFLPEQGVIRYRWRASGKEFMNGYRSDQVLESGIFLSAEIRVAVLGANHEGAALDWLEVVDQPAIEELRQRFNAEVRRVVPASVSA